MDENIFRKKSLERISSPEALNDYLHVTTPAIWLILMAVVVMLAGFFIWASVGNVSTTVKGEAYVTNGKVTMVINNMPQDNLKAGLKLTIGDLSATIDYVDKDSYGRTTVECDMNIPDGVYEADIIVEQIKPISFLLSD
ncbi:hypothetical protein [Butyrivibrio sp. WCE2006]|uniref:hypothetical protein n=1 Tax=Butyrivibrio sp. WCE2006 TaxID=1410611 RepID=UPI0005D2BAFE|nr:hypothetical protein [Butyrivibrio sp. WCE2006]